MRHNDQIDVLVQSYYAEHGKRIRDLRHAFDTLCEVEYAMSRPHTQRDLPQLNASKQAALPVTWEILREMYSYFRHSTINDDGKQRLLFPMEIDRCRMRVFNEVRAEAKKAFEELHPEEKHRRHRHREPVQR